jgi:hypothetical protein
MAPARVDSNKKQANSSVGRVEEELFCIDTMARTVSGPSQATVHLARKTAQELYYKCFDEGEAWQFPIPRLLYKIDYQARFAAARATVLQYTLPVPTSKKTSSPHCDSDDDSDGPPPSPKRTDATEMKIDKSLQIFINAMPHLEPLHFGLKLQASIQKGYCFCPLAKSLSPWRKYYHVDNDYSVCWARHFQGSVLLQHYCSKGDEYHTATAFYLTTLYKKGMGMTQAAVHHGENDQ